MLRLLRIRISHRRRCPRCRSQNIAMQHYGFRSEGRYDCLDCQDEFRGLKFFGIRVAIYEEDKFGPAP